jgi:hypothetical protein
MTTAWRSLEAKSTAHSGRAAVVGLLGVVAAGGVCGGAWTPAVTSAAAVAAAGPDLVPVLRGMALSKLVMVAPASTSTRPIALDADSQSLRFIGRGSKTWVEDLGRRLGSKTWVEDVSADLPWICAGKSTK